MHQRLLVVAALAVLASFHNTALGQGCDPAELFEDRVNYDAFTARAVAISDLNGDGHADLAVASLGGNQVSVLLNDGDGTFAAAVNYGAGADPTAIAVGDLDGDGDGDLVTSNSGANNVSVLLNNGDGTFAPHVLHNAGGSPRFVAIGDLDGDGALDLATAITDASNVAVLRNNGDGTFAAAVRYSVGNAPSSVAIGDLDGDGALDLATANAGTALLSVLLNNGDGTYAPQEYFAAALATISVAIGDLDGDGDGDLVATSFAENLASVLLNNGDGTFAPHVDYGIGREPYSVAIGDLNNDGIPDLATANSSASAANRVSVLAGNGDGTFAPRTGYQVGSRPLSVAMGDLNGDGAPDLATANVTGGTVSVLLNRCVPPTITTQPASVLLPVDGGVAEFGVAASGSGPLLYQWRRDGVDLVDGGGVSGATTSTLTIHATSEDIAAYDVVISDGGAITLSAPGILAVRANPCPADFDADGSLTLFDFLEFSNAFAGGCP